MKPPRYNKEDYPPMSKTEFLYFGQCLKENWDLYLDEPYLRYYWGYEYVRIIMKRDPIIMDIFEDENP